MSRTGGAGRGPQTHYARTGDAHIAYQVDGDGPIDLVLVPGFVSNVEHYWEMTQRRPDLRARWRRSPG